MACLGPWPRHLGCLGDRRGLSRGWLNSTRHPARCRGWLDPVESTLRCCWLTIRAATGTVTNDT